MLIMQGGPGFPILADPIYHYISTGEVAPVETYNENIPPHIKSIVNQVCICDQVWENQPYLHKIHPYAL